MLKGILGGVAVLVFSPSSLCFRQLSVLPPDPHRGAMPVQTAFPSPPRVLSSSRCDRCQGVTTVRRITPSRVGYEHWTRRCTRCSHIHQEHDVCSPSRPGPLDWFDPYLHEVN